jgi:hypothetical protein
MGPVRPRKVRDVTSTDEDLKTLLKRNPRAIANLRHQFQNSRLTLVLGAGVGFGFGLPNWKKLIDRLARDPTVNQSSILSTDRWQKWEAGTKTEVLYREFQRRKMRSAAFKEVPKEHRERHIRGQWHEAIRRSLYKTIRNEGTEDDPALRHPYMGAYLDIILQSPFTINYNFDSCVELMLDTLVKEHHARDKSYETAFDAAFPFRHNTGVIFHPNGYLPYNVADTLSEEVIFSDEGFGKQLLETEAGKYSTLIHFLSKNTCLFVGLSFNDETLRHLLRRFATNNSGHYHYAVELLRGRKREPERHEVALAQSRFELYNLITIWTTENQIEAVGKLVTLNAHAFHELCRAARVSSKFVYYITGIPGAGKTTVVRHMNALLGHPEWLTQPLPLMRRPWNTLGKDEKAEVDNFVGQQYCQKNYILATLPEGLYLVDRGPLDALTFVKKGGVSRRAREYRRQITGRPPAAAKSVVPGAVIALEVDPTLAAYRRVKRGGTLDSPEYLRQLWLAHKRAYGEGMRVIPTRDRSIAEVVKDVSRHIHCEPYHPINLDTLLREAEKT